VTGTRSVPELAGLVLRRDGSARVLTGGVVLLGLAAVALFAFPAITDLVSRVRQHHLSQQFDNPQYTTVYRHHGVPVGHGLTRLEIDTPRVSVDVLVVQGVTTSALRAGAGHYPSTPYPCDAGNVGIAGHRTTYGRPFNRIDQMRAGDTITLVTPLQRCVYRVLPSVDGHVNPWIVAPSDVGVVGQAGMGAEHLLTMTSCNPKGSAAQRIVLRSALIGVVNRTP
jgi:sortase A